MIKRFPDKTKLLVLTGIFDGQQITGFYNKINIYAETYTNHIYKNVHTFISEIQTKSHLKVCNLFYRGNESEKVSSCIEYDICKEHESCSPYLAKQLKMCLNATLNGDLCKYQHRHGSFLPTFKNIDRAFSRENFQVLKKCLFFCHSAPHANNAQGSCVACRRQSHYSNLYGRTGYLSSRSFAPVQFFFSF